MNLIQRIDTVPTSKCASDALDRQIDCSQAGNILLNSRIATELSGTVTVSLRFAIVVDSCENQSHVCVRNSV